MTLNYILEGNWAATINKVKQTLAFIRMFYILLLFLIIPYLVVFHNIYQNFTWLWTFYLRQSTQRWRNWGSAFGAIAPLSRKILPLLKKCKTNCFYMWINGALLLALLLKPYCKICFSVFLLSSVPYWN